MQRAIDQLQGDFLTPEQITASHQVMGLDSQLVRDGTYFMAEANDQIAGCGGWSFRTTLFGGDDSIVEREPERLDPRSEPAKVRAMYTNPDFVRRGVGTKILELCETAARDAGFSRVELMGTAAGVPLYESRGYRAISPLELICLNGISVPLLRIDRKSVV